MPVGIDGSRRIVIERVYPELDCGRYAVKREVGDTLAVEADIFKEGHEVIAAAIRYRPEVEAEWHEAPMRFIDNDRWGGTVRLERNCRYLFTIVAWTDGFGSWRTDLRKKHEAGQEVSSELLEGAHLIERAIARSTGVDRDALRDHLDTLESAATPAERILLVLSAELLELMERNQAREDLTLYDRELPVQVDRLRARFAAWYELFPRSMSDDAARHGTFDDVIAKLPYVRDMGFDVLYFPPIHPIGRSFR